MLKKILVIPILAILLAISIQAKPPEDCYTGCPDVNHNDKIDEFDLVLVALQFGKDVEPDSPYKINRTPNSQTKVVNKFVGKDDLSCVGESFGENVKDFPVCKKEKDKLLAKGCECADVNRNGEVDIFDLVLVSGNFGSKEPKYKIKKEKDNDVVGVEDLVCVGQSFGKPGAEVGCKYCSDCGDGVINKCDKEECIGLGDCEYTPNDFPLLGETLIGGKCEEKEEIKEKKEEKLLIEKELEVVKCSFELGIKCHSNYPFTKVEPDKITLEVENILNEAINIISISAENCGESINPPPFPQSIKPGNIVSIRIWCGPNFATLYPEKYTGKLWATYTVGGKTYETRGFLSAFNKGEFVICKDGDDSQDYTPQLYSLSLPIMPNNYPDFFVKRNTKLDYVKNPDDDLQEGFSDYCSDDKKLIEGFCLENEGINAGMNSITVLCPNGCEDGKCRPEGATKPETQKQTEGVPQPKPESTNVPPIPPPQEKNPIAPPPN